MHRASNESGQTETSPEIGAFQETVRSNRDTSLGMRILVSSKHILPIQWHPDNRFPNRCGFKDLGFKNTADLRRENWEESKLKHHKVC